MANPAVALLASFFAMVSLPAWRYSRWTWLQKVTYSGLAIFLARHGAFALLSSPLLVSFRYNALLPNGRGLLGVAAQGPLLCHHGSICG